MRLKSTLAAFSALGMILAACSGSSDEAAEPSEPDTSEEVSDPGDSEDSETTELDGEPVNIAVIVPFSGASAKTAQQMFNGAELAANEINADGGIDGRPIELMSYDSELDPEVAGREAQRAITRDGAVAIIGAQSSGEALAIREVVERSEVPFITSSATVEAITVDAVYTYRIAPLLTDYANGVVDIGQAIGLESPAVLHDSGGAGILLLDLFLARAGEVGASFSGAPIEYPFNGTDMSAQVASAAGQNPDGVLIGGSAGGDHGLVAITMVEQGLDVPLIGFSPILVDDALDIGGQAYEELPAVYSLQNLDQNKASFIDFRDRYYDEYGDDEVLTEHPAQTYDALMIMAIALRSTGGEGGSALVEALDATEPYTGASGRDGADIEFSADRRDGYLGDYLVAYRMEGTTAVQEDLDF